MASRRRANETQRTKHNMSETQKQETPAGQAAPHYSAPSWKYKLAHFSLGMLAGGSLLVGAVDLCVGRSVLGLLSSVTVTALFLASQFLVRENAHVELPPPGSAASPQDIPGG